MIGWRQESVRLSVGNVDPPVLLLVVREERAVDGVRNPALAFQSLLTPTEEEKKAI